MGCKPRVAIQPCIIIQQVAVGAHISLDSVKHKAHSKLLGIAERTKALEFHRADGFFALLTLLQRNVRIFKFCNRIFHSIIEVGLEGTFRGHLVQPYAPGRLSSVQTLLHKSSV